MTYLEIENGRCEGWTIPMYYDSAVQFANEVKQVCIAGSTGTGIIDTPDGKVKTHFTYYKYKDGTRFILTYDKNGELIEIEAKDIYDDDFYVIYYNR